jgi:hypothetical protein
MMFEAPIAIRLDDGDNSMMMGMDQPRKGSDDIMSTPNNCSRTEKNKNNSKHHDAENPRQQMLLMSNVDWPSATRKRHMAARLRQLKVDDDPLGVGGSLHSTLKRIQPRRMLRDDVVEVKSSPQGGDLRLRSGSVTKRKSRRGSEKNISCNTNYTRGGDYDLDDLLLTTGPRHHHHYHHSPEKSPPSPPPLPALSSGREFRKLNNTDGCCDTHPVTLWCDMISNGHKRWTMFQLVFLIILGGGLWTHSSHRVHVAHQALEASHLEKSSILSQMEWLDSRAKQNMVEMEQKSDSGQEVQYQRQIQAMAAQIRLLEESLQEAARERLKSSGIVVSADSPLLVEIIMDGAKAPLVLQLWHDEMPYTTMTWLDQIRNGMWTNANLQHVDNSWIDIHPTRTTTTTTAGGDAPSRLAFMEESKIGGDRRFELGMRNHPGHENMFVLTIHLEVGTCESDMDEVCFGELVGGFDELVEMDMETHLVTSVAIKDQ